MARMSGFVFQDGYLERLAKLSDQEVGRMVRALAEYHATGKEPELTGRESVAFDFIKADIDKADKAYQAKCSNMKRTQLTAIDRNCIQLPANGSNKNKNKNRNIKETPLTGSKEKTGAKAPDRAFDTFWAVYPRKEGKQAARKAFAKLAPDDQLLNTMLTAIQKQKQTDQWSDPRYIPHPATWLNGRRWEDEVTQGSPGKTVTAQRYGQREYDEDELEKKLGVNDIFAADWKGATG